MPRFVKGCDYGAAICQEVIDRWRRCSDGVFSINSKGELPSISMTLRNIEIIEIEGTERVKIADLTKQAIKLGFDRTVIANADCVPFDTGLLSDLISSVQTNEMCMIRRTNLSEDLAPISRQVFHGVDAFVLGANALKNAHQNGAWKIGESCWDIWFPIFLRSKGVDVFGIVPYPLIHFDHGANWNNHAWLMNARRMIREIPLDSPAYGEKIRLLHFDRHESIDDRTIQRIFDGIAELLFNLNRPTPFQPGSFNALFAAMIQRQLGPDTRAFERLIALSDNRILHWFLKTFPKFLS